MQPIGAGYIAKFIDAGALARVQAPKSEAQAEAGNYRKAHIRAFGLDIAIENPKGTIRRKLTPDGEEKWRVKMPAHYGYLKGTTGADKDAVDCYIGPDKDAKLVWIVDQIRPSDGSFDEHKCLLGFRSYEDAVKAYEAGFSDGSGAKRKGAVVEMDLAEFRDWLKNGDSSKPLAYDGALAKAQPAPSRNCRCPGWMTARCPQAHCPRAIGKSWDESRHPRDHGRFTAAGSDAWAGKSAKEKRAAIETATAKMKAIVDRAHAVGGGPLLRQALNEVGAIRDPKIGPIDFRMGQAGSAEKDFKDGYGIDHIIARRSKIDGQSDDDVRRLLLAIPRVIANGERDGWRLRRPGDQDERMTIDTPTIRVVLSRGAFGQQSNPFVLTAFYRKDNVIRKGLEWDEEPQWVAAPFAERTTLHTSGQRVVSIGGEEGWKLSGADAIGKAWSEAKVVRDQVGRFAFKNGGRAAIGVGIAAAGLGLGALAAKFLKPSNESKPIINETALWQRHNLQRAEMYERSAGLASKVGGLLAANGLPPNVDIEERAARLASDARYYREAASMADDEPMPVPQKDLGAKARLPSTQAAKPAAQAIGTLLTGDKAAKWEKRSDGLVLGSDGPDGVAARSLYQDKSGELIARIDLAIRHNDGVGGAREGLKREVEAYKALGVDRVALHANIEIGAYAWARMGFVPGQKSWDVLRKGLAEKTKETGYRKLDKVLASPDPKGIWKVADARSGSLNVGLELLKGEHWFGSLPLNDAQAMNRFNTYVSQKKG